MLDIEEYEKQQVIHEARAYNLSIQTRFYLPVAFTTLQEYLALLEMAGKMLAPLGARACFYLAAAVSDFYIPDDQV